MKEVKVWSSEYLGALQDSIHIKPDRLPRKVNIKKIRTRSEAREIGIDISDTRIGVVCEKKAIEYALPDIIELFTMTIPKNETES